MRPEQRAAALHRAHRSVRREGPRQARLQLVHEVPRVLLEALPRRRQLLPPLLPLLRADAAPLLVDFAELGVLLHDDSRLRIAVHAHPNHGAPHGHLLDPGLAGTPRVWGAPVVRAPIAHLQLVFLSAVFDDRGEHHGVVRHELPPHVDVHGKVEELAQRRGPPARVELDLLHGLGEVLGDVQRHEAAHLLLLLRRRRLLLGLVVRVRRRARRRRELKKLIRGHPGDLIDRAPSFPLKHRRAKHLLHGVDRALAHKPCKALDLVPADGA
mmetsp:Transcript_14554/g.43746  ORF Transcript_14554/g.43746 Transcript_14554/m.43746 type:complete len:269 (-) Transcript_14554:781-1587(-)